MFKRIRIHFIIKGGKGRSTLERSWNPRQNLDGNRMAAIREAEQRFGKIRFLHQTCF